MSTFEYLSVALSLILGLGVTHLLLGILRVFGARHRQRIDWIPITWAAGIFLLQIQFWWSTFELVELLETWTQVTFSILLAHVIMLFVAGALILPTSIDQERETLQEHFRQDGRWALPALAIYSAIALLNNRLYFGASFTNISQILIVIYGVMVMVAFFSTKRWLLSAITIAQASISVFVYLYFAASAY